MPGADQAASQLATRLVTRLRGGDARALARAISLIEDDAPFARELLSACFPHTGSALTIGITGPPGAGKSSLVDQLCLLYRSRQITVGVLAVDPSSPYSNGALLGDRIRMQRHHADPGFYLRSMATRGALGGLARATAHAASLLDAGGKQRILIETVGVGQDEIDIVRLADITIVVLVPGMGDDVQSIKAGIMEVADIFALNKSDREGADRLEAEVRAMQSHGGPHCDKATGWVPPVLRTISTSGEGIAELAATIDTCHAWLLEEDRLTLRRRAQWKQRLVEMVRHEILAAVRLKGLDDAQMDSHAAAIVGRLQNPFEIASELVSSILVSNILSSRS